MDRNFAPNYYPAGTKVIYEDGTNNILRGTNYLSPGNYHLGKKIVAIDISEIPDAEARGQIENQMAEQRRIAEAGAERQRANEAAIQRVYMERREREVAEQAERRRIWEAGAEEREIADQRRDEQRMIEAARPHDNNNPAPRNDNGRPWDGAGNPLYWGGRKSRRARKSKKSKKRRSIKRRARKTIRRRR